MNPRPLLLLALGAVLWACSPGDDGQVHEEACQIVEASAPDSLQRIGCKQDFVALGSAPLDTSLPGAQSVKVVLDRQDQNALYFQNSVKFQIHYAFASTHLSGNGRPVVGTLADFNSVQYFSPDRRFLLGAVTYYEQPQKWVLELAPYDTASAEMITKLFLQVKHAAFFGPELGFHPTSSALETVAAILVYRVVLDGAPLVARGDVVELQLWVPPA